MNDRLKPLAAAFQFLSRFPVRVELDFSPELLRRSSRYYPVVGATIGAVVLGLGYIFSYILPSQVVAVLLLIGWIWLTGGLHLDGWMDTADGLLSYRSKEKMLEIMKDSRVGAMAVIACVLLLLLKFTLLAALLDQGWLYPAIVLAPIWSRWFMGYAMIKWPSARGNEGLAGRFSSVNARDVFVSTTWAILVSVVILIMPLLFGYRLLGWYEPGLYVIVFPLVTWIAGSILAGRISARLGGLTGDTYGALNEALEAMMLLIALPVLMLV